MPTRRHFAEACKGKQFVLPRSKGGAEGPTRKVARLENLVVMQAVLNTLGDLMQSDNCFILPVIDAVSSLSLGPVMQVRPYMSAGQT